MKLKLTKEMINMPVIIKCGGNEYRGNSVRIVREGETITTLTICEDVRGSDYLDVPYCYEAIETEIDCVKLEVGGTVLDCNRCYIETYKNREFLIFEGDDF